ncbi:HAUS augmin-like complex subunit 2 isoform X1 [Microcaecilia unicolor]|uniref:HAUS augmin-like complex subunit 2 isoform X1 n=1 Tax=Microcaecilia unicolor TaxID=1415580 RepID=A0A6P7Z2I8_9AMPH|nr:HAUS augmin-like complex subunit 2 isoform X1 [Microcaecilia unicolor]XP_030070939.1 HAUS augmin-like complex subunit 2 isoform X1 [Microcaecilia unicolor]XP_030070940.1 HAUS augmin-like complex subunit 2 isoform X1 [Microcaecilia unicolor]XP_030070941.1 HAUS augmin-like complex subunit 2 isoform X1 [Microcaecilia unicolor]
MFCTGLMASANPWDPVQPTAASMIITKCLESEVVTQKALDLSRRECPCFVRVAEFERIADIKAEINQKSLEIELLQLEKQTADIAHPLYLSQKCQALQVMNSHLEAVLKEKRTLRQRLARPLCQENLAIEASYHRYVVELLMLAVTFIEKLEAYLRIVRAITRVDDDMKSMDSALARIEAMEAEMEEVTEQILKWREQQRAVHQASSKLPLGYRCSSKSAAPYLSL